MDTLFTKALLAETKAQDDGAKVYRFRATTGVIDRQGEVVTPDGWQTDSFMANPVFLVAHDYSSLPIGKVVAIANDGAGLVADVVFDMADPKAAEVARKYDAGFLNAVSVGFRSIERSGSWSDPSNPIKHVKKELLEISAVAVPANPEALALRSLEAKAGRKLSQKNESLIRQAMECLQTVVGSLGQAEPEDEGKSQDPPATPDADPTAGISLDISGLKRFVGKED